MGCRFIAAESVCIFAASGKPFRALEQGRRIKWHKIVLGNASSEVFEKNGEFRKPKASRAKKAHRGPELYR
jgi:hypothetical protein